MGPILNIIKIYLSLFDCSKELRLANQNNPVFKGKGFNYMHGTIKMLFEVSLTSFFSEGWWVIFPNYRPKSDLTHHYCNIAFTVSVALRVSKLLTAFGK